MMRLTVTLCFQCIYVMCFIWICRMKLVFMSIIEPLIKRCNWTCLFTFFDRLLFDGRIFGPMRERSRDPDNFRSLRAHAHWSLRARRLRLRRLLQWCHRRAGSTLFRTPGVPAENSGPGNGWAETLSVRFDALSRSQLPVYSRSENASQFLHGSRI